jgi:hypothetical protein
MSVQQRAQVKLQGSTDLSPDKVLALIKRAATSTKGGGASLLTTGIQNLGAQIHVEGEGESGLSLSLTSAKKISRLGSLTADVRRSGERTNVRVGGLQEYKTNQTAVLGFIPMGPKMIPGYDLYKRFLNAIADEIRGADPSADVTIA